MLWYFNRPRYRLLSFFPRNVRGVSNAQAEKRWREHSILDSIVGSVPRPAALKLSSSADCSKRRCYSIQTRQKPGRDVETRDENTPQIQESRGAEDTATCDLSPGLNASKTKSTRRIRQSSAQITPQLPFVEASPHHHDLTSFLEHSSRMNLDPTTNVFKGTHYEYMVAEALKSFNFTLLRIGRANDLGIDLIGQWHLPGDLHELKVLIQCKASRSVPAMIRELEGAYRGAPAGWGNDGVMALLATTRPTTLGIREALQRSRLPMGVLQITGEGRIEQFVWNQAARDARLTGLSVASVHAPISNNSIPELKGSKARVPTISLLWMGMPWKGGPL